MRLHSSLEMSDCYHGLITYWQPMWHPCTPVTQTELNADVAGKLNFRHLARHPPLLTAQTHIRALLPHNMWRFFRPCIGDCSQNAIRPLLTQWACISNSSGQNTHKSKCTGTDSSLFGGEKYFTSSPAENEREFSTHKQFKLQLYPHFPEISSIGL